MISNEQFQASKAEALAFITANTFGDVRAFLAGALSVQPTTVLDWGDATGVVLDQEVRDAQLAAAEAYRVAKIADEAEAQRAHAAWLASLPVQAAPVVPTAPAAPVVLTRQDHIEAIKAAYGEDFNLQAACRYALYNGISADDVANTVARPVGECVGLMYPG